MLNRSVGKMHLFGKDADFEAFQRVLIEAHQRHPIRILSYCVLSNHWHFAVWPDAGGQVTAFFRWLAHTHAMGWRVAHRTVGYGRLYQGRFKSFPVQSDEHLLTVLRYIERNAVGAGLVGHNSGDTIRFFGVGYGVPATIPAFEPSSGQSRSSGNIRVGETVYKTRKLLYKILDRVQLGSE